jgi:hypothetical protein
MFEKNNFILRKEEIQDRRKPVSLQFIRKMLNAMIFLHHFFQERKCTLKRKDLGADKQILQGLLYA